MSEENRPVEAQKPAIDEKKKNALLRYVAIMFAVAFLLVLFSMITQMRDSRNQISQLNQSSSSALQKAEQLQDTNRVLEENNELLKDEIGDLNQQIADLEQQLAAVNTETQDLRDEEARQAEKLAAEREQVQLAYEQLLHFAAGDGKADPEKLEAMKAYLGPKGLETYETALKADKGEENHD